MVSNSRSWLVVEITTTVLHKCLGIRWNPHERLCAILSGMSEAPSLAVVVGRTLKAFREERGWTQEAVAQRLKLVGLSWTRFQLSDIEAGRRDISAAEMLLIAEALGVRVADLLEGDGFIELSDSERPLRAVRAVLAGELAPNSDLLGPTDIPGLVGGPYWTRSGNRRGEMYSNAEVAIARWLGVDVARVQHELTQEVGVAARRIHKGLLSDAQYERLAGALARLANDPSITPEATERRLRLVYAA
jgi:transcriptional regulator with XRE-family HTH domain